MRAGRLATLAALVLGLAAPSAHATPHFIVGTGQNPGVAVDGAGTAYIGWKVNVYAATGDADARGRCGSSSGAAAASPETAPLDYLEVM